MLVDKELALQLLAMEIFEKVDATVVDLDVIGVVLVMAVAEVVAPLIFEL